GAGGGGGGGGGGDEPDGPGDAPAVAGAAAAPEHRAGVHARAAADARERPAERLVGELARAPVVHDDDVELAAAARAMKMRRVAGHRLAGRGARQEAQEHGQILPPW